MLEQFTDAFAILRAEAATYPMPVQIWMKVMFLSFFSGLIFAIWDRRALWIVAMAAATALGLILAKAQYPQVSREQAGVVIHLVVWPAALFALWRPRAAGPLPFKLWRYWVTGLIAISLLLDLKGLVGAF